jgi:hypothetical protein
MTESATIGIVSPGAMGSALGRTWSKGGSTVIATVAGRSNRTRSLATDLALVADLESVISASRIVVSVAPPNQAVAIASNIARVCRETGSRPLVVDVNATSPATMAQVADILQLAGCEVVDGSISGPPPAPRSSTLLYLAGPRASVVADLPVGPGLRAVVVGNSIGQASAVKMCTASMYKGITGLLLQALATAQYNEVLQWVQDDLRRAYPDLIESAGAQIAVAASKSDRFPGEMREIAGAQAQAGLRPELFQAMALIFEQAHRSPLGALTPEQAAHETDLERVLNLILGPVERLDRAGS